MALIDKLTAIALHPMWVPGADCPSGYKAQWSGRLWRCIQAHMSQAGWEPENAPSLWEEICESHSGTVVEKGNITANSAEGGGDNG